MAGPAIVDGAMTKCTFGGAPGTLRVSPVPGVTASGRSAATVRDHVALSNIRPFGMCTSLANPTVVAATAAALGVLTPMPCAPMTPQPWLPGVPAVELGGAPALGPRSTCQCAYRGVISVLLPGQSSVET
jgi:hypothetical protein